jgi:hypothetical protein
MFTITCPRCSTRLSAPEGAIGKEVKCQCGQSFVAGRSGPVFGEQPPELTVVPAAPRPNSRPFLIVIAIAACVIALCAVSNWIQEFRAASALQQRRDELERQKQHLQARKNQLQELISWAAEIERQRQIGEIIEAKVQGSMLSTRGATEMRERLVKKYARENYYHPADISKMNNELVQRRREIGVADGQDPESLIRDIDREMAELEQGKTDDLSAMEWWRRQAERDRQKFEREKEEFQQRQKG